MKILILAAGYATRLYPLTLDKPKPLLPVAGKPMLEHIIDHLLAVPGVQEYLIVTNDKFSSHFEKWAADYHQRHPEFSARVINDGSTSDANKLGAIGDIHLVTQKVEVADDLVIVAGDNLFNQSLAPFVEFARTKKTPVLGVYDVGSLEAIKKYSCITLDGEGRIVFFEEKPQNPASTLTGIALYYYPKEVVKLLDAYISEGNNPDQPGRFIQWLYTRMPVHTWTVPGIWYDIGSKESLEEADAIFSKPQP